MTTLLANRKMHPALRERVEASVTGRGGQGKAVRSGARRVSILRMGAIAAVAVPTALMATGYRRSRAELRDARAALSAEWTRQTGSLSADDRALLGRTEERLRSLAGEYPGDLVVDKLKSAGALGALLVTPSLYVRGPIAAFGSPPAIARAALESGKDAFLLCLLDPPSSRDEKSLLAKARVALGGGDSQQKSAPTAHRLHELEAGLPFLSPAWGQRVESARDFRDLSELERELRRAPLAAARSALRAKVLIAVFDEPNDGTGPTELDGEHTHQVRILLGELPGQTPLLRLRRRVDPSWISASRRSRYSRELDSCRLAMDLHDAVTTDSGARPP
jgi:hypothetical protein